MEGEEGRQGRKTQEEEEGRDGRGEQRSGERGRESGPQLFTSNSITVSTNSMLLESCVILYCKTCFVAALVFQDEDFHKFQYR